MESHVPEAGRAAQCGGMRYLLVGDSDQNIDWWAHVVEPAAVELDVAGIIQLGDFGYWCSRHGTTFQERVAQGPLPVWFLDGNHEHHDRLAADVAAARAVRGITDPTAPVPLGGALHYLPRGARLTLNGCRVAALGGAVSIDQAHLVEGRTWFPAEAVSDSDLAVLAAGGSADVLLTHDAPAGHRIPKLKPAWQLPPLWRRYHPACEAHRDQVRRAVEAVQPRLVVHGHFHLAYRTVRDEPWGPVEVVGLHRDGHPAALIVLDVSDPEPRVRRILWDGRLRPHLAD